MNEIKICVVGGGRWGQNHIKTLLSLGVKTSCVDIDSKKINQINTLYPFIKCFSSIQNSFQDSFSGYIIATPASTHKALALEIICKRIPILVEKPLALSLNDALEIKSELVKNNGKLVVGHLLLFHPAIKKN